MTAQKKLIALDILRGIACLLVWFSHIRVATQYFKDSKYDFIQSFTAWGHEAVIIFFILSGIVINLSSQNKLDRPAYFKKRFIRIYPIYFAVFLICFLSVHFIFKYPVSLRTFFGNLFLSGTLQSYIAPTMPMNAAVWSITCEVFFYIIFGIFYTSNRIKWIWVWFFVCCLSIIYKIIYDSDQSGLLNQLIFLLNNSFLWLLGYLVFEYRNKITTSFPVAIAGLLMVPMVTRVHQLSKGLLEFMLYLAGLFLLPLFIYLLKNYKPTAELKRNINYLFIAPLYMVSLLLLWNYSNSLTNSKIIYSFIPFLSLVFYLPQAMGLIYFLYKSLKSSFAFLADISYPLYLLHMPVMYIVYNFLPGQKTVGMLLVVFFTVSLSYIFEIYLFKKLSGNKN